MDLLAKSEQPEIIGTNKIYWVKNNEANDSSFMQNRLTTTTFDIINY